MRGGSGGRRVVAVPSIVAVEIVDLVTGRRPLESLWAAVNGDPIKYSVASAWSRAALTRAAKVADGFLAERPELNRPRPGHGDGLGEVEDARQKMEGAGNGA